ncbi:MAG: hypothetical protein HOV87_34670, partial [Catenulispora sp.]|nr:hypothetical protein [Catenulispora sp.]
GGPAKPPFLKTTNGLLAAIAAAVVVVGGGVGLAVGLSGGGSLGSALKGTWHCTTKGSSEDDNGSGTMTIDDGTWKIGGSAGTWKQDGGKVTLTENAHPGDPVTVTGVPTGTGSVDTQLKSAGSDRFGLHLKGDISSSAIHLEASREGETLKIDCTK